MRQLALDQTIKRNALPFGLDQQIVTGRQPLKTDRERVVELLRRRATAGDEGALDLADVLAQGFQLPRHVPQPLVGLRERFGGSLPRFDLMAQLDRHPAGLKMRELSQRLMVTGGNVTGLTDRLVAERLVERTEDPDDRRAFTVRLTPEGRRQFRAMAREHERWVASLFEGLDAASQTELFRLLGLLKKALPADTDADLRRRRPQGGRSATLAGRAG